MDSNRNLLQHPDTIPLVEPQGTLAVWTSKAENDNYSLTGYGDPAFQTRGRRARLQLQGSIELPGERVPVR